MSPEVKNWGLSFLAISWHSKTAKRLEEQGKREMERRGRPDEEEEEWECGEKRERRMEVGEAERNKCKWLLTVLLFLFTRPHGSVIAHSSTFPNLCTWKEVSSMPFLERHTARANHPVCQGPYLLDLPCSSFSLHCCSHTGDILLGNL